MHLFRVTSLACICSQGLGKEGKGFDMQLFAMQSLLGPSPASCGDLGYGTFLSLFFLLCEHGHALFWVSFISF